MKRAFSFGSVLLTAAFACAFVQGSRVDRDERARVFELLDIESGDVVADVGAGDGKWSIAVAKQVGPEGRVYATEVDPDDLKKIRDRVEREGATNVSVVEGQTDSTGLPDACCDAICCLLPSSTSRRREAQTGSRARSGSRSERTLDAVEHSRTLMEWWPFLIFHRGGLRIKVINNTILLRRVYHHFTDPEAMQESLRKALREDARLLVVDFDTRGRWSRPSGIPESRDGHGIAKTLLVTEMEGAGFELVSDLKWHNGDYALVFKER